MTTPGDDPLREVRHHWSDAYAIGPNPDGDGVCALRRDGQGVLIAPDAEALWDAMARDFAARPVSLKGADEVGRMRVMLAAYPGAEAWFRSPLWFGSFPLAGDDRWLWTGPANDLRIMLDRLGEFPAMAALCAAIESEHPGWQVRRSFDGRWRATRLRPGAALPLGVDVPNSLALLDELYKVTRAEARWPRWTFWRRGDEWGATHSGDLAQKRPGGSVDGLNLADVETHIADVEEAWASRDRRLADRPAAAS